MNKKRNQKGFTLVELLIVIAIIGILAAIAIPQFSTYRVRAYNATALADIKNAYTAGQAFFSDSPTGTLDNTSIATSGYNPTNGVTLTISSGTQAGLCMNTRHGNGTTSYYVNANGVIDTAGCVAIP